MSTVDRVTQTAAAFVQARMKDREEGGGRHTAELAQTVPWVDLKPALDLAWALSAIDIETFSKDLDADAEDVARTIASMTDAPAEMAAHLARLVCRHPSVFSLKVVRNLMDHAIEQFEEGTKE
jgi:hypothetical protein